MKKFGEYIIVGSLLVGTSFLSGCCEDDEEGGLFSRSGCPDDAPSGVLLVDCYATLMQV